MKEPVSDYPTTDSRKADELRKQRLAQALRANLQKRKGQAKARAAGAAEQSASKEQRKT